MIPDTLYIEGTRYTKEHVANVQMWQVIKSNQDYGKPCPAVVILKDDQHAFFDKQWQFYVRAMNYGKSIKYVSALYGGMLAFFNNGHGFPPCHNYLTGEGASNDDPNADKVRTCLLNVVTGEEDGKFLKVKTFDSRALPPIKEGCSYPNTVEEIDINIYQYAPENNPEMFVVCSIINRENEITPFPNGAIYSWTKDNKPYSFLPLISNHKYGDVLFPLTHLKKIPLGSPIPSRYGFI